MLTSLVIFQHHGLSPCSFLRVSEVNTPSQTASERVVWEVGRNEVNYVGLFPLTQLTSVHLHHCTHAYAYAYDSSIASSEIFLFSPSLGQIILLNLSLLSALLSVWNYTFTCVTIYITYLSSVYPSNYLPIIYLSPKQTIQCTQWEEKAHVLLLTIKSIGGLKCY